MISVRVAAPAEFEAARKFICSLFPDAMVQVEDCDTVLLAEHDGKPIGFLHLIEEEDRFLLQGIGVVESMRSRGVGTLLMERALDLLRHNPKPVYLKVKALNPAVDLYARYGFAMKKFGERHVLVKMVDA